MKRNLAVVGDGDGCDKLKLITDKRRRRRRRVVLAQLFGYGESCLGISTAVCNDGKCEVQCRGCVRV